MKNTKVKLITFLSLFLWTGLSLQAQTAANTEVVYGTMDAGAALKLKKEFPEDIKILGTNNGSSAVLLTESGTEEAHHISKTHGPGYVYEVSEQNAIKSISTTTSYQSYAAKKAAPAYKIDQADLVATAMDLVDNTKIATQIVALENFGTRYHTTSKAAEAARSVKTTWEQLTRNRTDVTVKLVSHNSTTMPSVVLTVKGSKSPDDYVLMGGHLDSTARGSTTTDAPGADDNASGIATITEIIRVLMDMNYRPERTIEFMAFAAEEVGLRGSKEIAQDYKRRGVNVVTYVQFDMTNYKGSSRDIYIYNDTYTSTGLNNFLFELMDTYNGSGRHQFSYGTSVCNYGCSDHFSWAQEGFDTSFPSEASFSESNPNIHTNRDTYSRFPTDNATHAAKFAKLGLSYMIEVSTNSGTTTGGTDICEGIAPFDSATPYAAGEKVTYQGRLFERTATGWIEIGLCSPTRTTPVPTVVGKCDDVNTYDQNTSYQIGDKVTFQGDLYERVSGRWENLGSCTSESGEKANLDLNDFVSVTNGILNVYPNPVTNNVLTISIANNSWKNGTIQIFNAQGQAITTFASRTKTLHIDLSSYASGMYFMKLSTDEGISNVRFIKQ